MMRKMQATILSLCLVILLAIVLAAIGSPIQSIEARAEEPVAAKTGFWTMRHNASWGRGHHQMNCDPTQVDSRIDDLTAYVEGFVEFNPDQDAAWDQLVSKIRSAGATYARICTEFDQQDAQANAPERLALAEKALAATLTAMQEARPAFNDFYATLNEEQKELLDRAFSRRHHH